ncbi:hypothetical protein Pla175_46180 [Pirellulimonas nuda]|uniref:Uncharacterized protein n=1 Tax=Pirellulimonas nuda TaxID=2528009 RepID=A0A518DI92_9BACT|nr:hypothetical protein [Pirellulimonas nuda]QDU91198.1 hypothetical protein Pla175_46180 [Pirellulimonas nuda]
MRCAPSFVPVTLLAVIAAGFVEPAVGQSFWERFAPVERVSAEPKGDYTLTDKHGPWLIMASTFSGEGAEKQARELALELRSRQNLNAYVHNMEFDYSGGVTGKGLDIYGEPIRMRYQRGSEVTEFTVLVGDFAAVDDPRAQRMLQDIKTMHPEALSATSGKSSAQNYGGFRSWLRGRSGGAEGPMRTAFMAPNPLLPHDYFTPRGVEKEVAKWNSRVEHSLLKAPNRYTVRVATFRGRGTLQGAASVMSTRVKNKKADDGEALVEAAENAHLLTEALRDAGYEAYEFHDRDESYVTIGSFDRVSQTSPDGSETPTAEVQRIIQTFGAAYNTPAEPLPSPIARKQLKVDPAVVQAQFNQAFAGEVGQTAAGLTPKFAQVEAERGKFRPVPFDIQPYVMDAPKKTVSGVFSWR